MRTTPSLLVALLLGSWACRRAAEAPPARGEPLALPDALAGFTGAPIEHGRDFVRRTYTHGATHVDATLALTAALPGGFEGWLAMSRGGGYPQAALNAPAGDVNGFYQCNDARPPSCDLLVQMRSGVHLELRGGGTSSRADVDALARALPLAAWGAGRIDDPH
jgi:hypothetical protein